MEREDALGPDGRDAWDAQLADAAMAQVAALSDEQVAEQLQVGPSEAAAACFLGQVLAHGDDSWSTQAV